MGRLDKDKLVKRSLTALAFGPACLYLAYIGGLAFYTMLVSAFVIAAFEGYNLALKLKRRVFYAVVITLYIAVCFSAFAALSVVQGVSPFLLILLVAASDIGAYFFGKLIGGPKMARRISPNKTWAGLLGACLCPAIFNLFWFLKWADADVLIGSNTQAFVFGAFIGVAGQMGDLAISALKRRARVKDTGQFLPGHGGLLDRIDALMLAAPVYLMANLLA